MYAPSGKAQDYTANIGLSEENFVPNPEVQDLARENGLLHTACSETLGEVFGLSVSADANRSDPLPLENQTLSEKVYIFLSPLFSQLQIIKVKFFLDGWFIKTEWYAPYDLRGTRYRGTATPLKTRFLENGSHRLRAKIIFSSGKTFSIITSFIVSNPTNDDPN